MPTLIMPVLTRLRQDLASALSAEAILSACRQAKYSWRNRKLDPVATVSLFLLQILHGNTACQHVVHFGNWTFSAVAYCKARKRLPLRVLQVLLEQFAAKFRKQSAASAQWLGHRVWVEDGSSFSMPDVPALQEHFGQPSGQRRGCGFPVAKWLALFDLATGMLLRVSAHPLKTHDMSKVSAVASALESGDVVLGDRGVSSYAHIALLLVQDIYAVFRLHQKVLVDFTPGRPMPTKLSWIANPQGLPHSLWVRSNGKWDQIVVWYKPKQKPKWLTPAQYAALPDEMTVRELRYRVSRAGFRVRVVTLVTTLLDSEIYPLPELEKLYRRRWQVELNFRHIKISMKMDVLKCRTVDGVMKELTMFALAYNLIRSVMVESAIAQDVSMDRVGFLDALRWLLAPGPIGNVNQILINPSRPDRVEPRVRKRRPKQYPLMKEPRSELRKDLLGKEVAA
jgi:DDE family transposase